VLNDPQYIAGVAPGVLRGNENVALLSASVNAGMLTQLVSLIAAPGGEPEPGPLRYILSTHTLEHLPHRSSERCHLEQTIAAGDNRSRLTA
jgi:hypothetical protein